MRILKPVVLCAVLAAAAIPAIASARDFGDRSYGYRDDHRYERDYRFRDHRRDEHRDTHFRRGREWVLRF